MDNLKDIENRNNDISDKGCKDDCVKHEDDKKEENSDNNMNDVEETEKDCEPPLDTTPIEIESMSKAKHTNMETMAEADFVQEFRQNIKFKLATDTPNKRFDSTENNDNEMKDVDSNHEFSDNENKF